MLELQPLPLPLPLLVFDVQYYSALYSMYRVWCLLFLVLIDLSILEQYTVQYMYITLLSACTLRCPHDLDSITSVLYSFAPFDQCEHVCVLVLFYSQYYFFQPFLNTSTVCINRFREVTNILL